MTEQQLRELLKKYIAHVVYNSDTDFIGISWEHGKDRFIEEEWKLLNEISKEVEEGK